MTVDVKIIIKNAQARLEVASTRIAKSVFPNRDLEQIAAVLTVTLAVQAAQEERLAKLEERVSEIEGKPFR
jgi:hypothetical protein